MRIVEESESGADTVADVVLVEVPTRGSGVGTVADDAFDGSVVAVLGADPVPLSLVIGGGDGSVVIGTLGFAVLGSTDASGGRAATLALCGVGIACTKKSVALSPVS